MFKTSVIILQSQVIVGFYYIQQILGYFHKDCTHMLFNPRTNKVILSCNVKFDETCIRLGTNIIL